MIKHLIALLAFSAAIVLGMPYFHTAVQWLMTGYTYVSQLLTEVFTGGQAGNIARGLIALLAIPVVVGLIPTLMYWFLRRHWFPYFMEIVWVIWLLQAGALVMMEKVATGA